jgi:DNA-binding CsgD family transcriptional regulator/tetratricopeptide (TPR) repeat protein
LALAEAGLAVVRRGGERVDVARLLHNRGVAEAALGDWTRAVSSWEEALVLYRAAGDRWGEADTLSSLGEAARPWDTDRAEDLLTESLVLFRTIGDPEGTALVLERFGWLARAQGQTDLARRRFDEGLELVRDKPFAVAHLCGRGAVALDHGDLPNAAESWREGLRLAHAFGDDLGVAWVLVWVAHLAATIGNVRSATLLLGAASAFRQALGMPAPKTGREESERLSFFLRARLGQDRFPRLFAKGQTLLLEEAITEARAILLATSAPSLIAPTAANVRGPLLSPREQEVLRLLVAGYSDKEIAGELGISYRTATTHVGHILGKLGVDSRAAAAVAAVRAGLA